MTNFPSGGVHIGVMGFSISVHKPVWIIGETFAASDSKNLHMDCCFCFQCCWNTSCSIRIKPSRLTWKEESNTFRSPKTLALSCSGPACTLPLRTPYVSFMILIKFSFVCFKKTKPKQKSKTKPQNQRWGVSYFFTRR